MWKMLMDNKVEYECWNNQMDCTEVDNLADFLDFSPVKLLLSVDPDEILNIQDMIRSHLPDDLCVRPHGTFLSGNHSGFHQ